MANDPPKTLNELRLSLWASSLTQSPPRPSIAARPVSLLHGQSIVRVASDSLILHEVQRFLQLADIVIVAADTGQQPIRPDGLAGTFT